MKRRFAIGLLCGALFSLTMFIGARDQVKVETFNKETKTIEVLYLDQTKPIYSDWQGYSPHVKVGNVTYSVNGDQMEIAGNFAVYGGESEAPNTVAFALLFRDETGAEIGRIEAGGEAAARELGSFSATLAGIVQEHTEVRMELLTLNGDLVRN